MFIFLCLLLVYAINIAFDYSYKRTDDNFGIYNTLYAVNLNLLDCFFVSMHCRRTCVAMRRDDMWSAAAAICEVGS